MNKPPITSPFSRSYVSQQKSLERDMRDVRISKVRTKQRAEALTSEDEEKRRWANGTLPGAPLSKRGGRKA